MSEPGSVPLTTGRLRELVLGRLCQLDESEWLAPTELAEMQAQGLAALAEHAQRFSPRFASRLERAGLSARDLRDVAALAALPPMTRREMQDGDHAYARAIPETHLPTSWVETTGSTEKINAFIKLMEPLGLADVCRTGVVAISRGPAAI